MAGLSGHPKSPIDGLPALSAEWQQMLAVLAVLSMGTGNIVAIAQTNIKRMLAYSTIAHMGFMLLGLLAAGFVSLAVIVVVFSIIGAYYYLRIVKLMYFDDPDDTSPIVCGQDTHLVLSFNGLAVLVLGLMPGVLMTLCLAARAGPRAWPSSTFCESYTCYK